jgi:hypothetical protein
MLSSVLPNNKELFQAKLYLNILSLPGFELPIKYPYAIFIRHKVIIGV